MTPEEREIARAFVACSRWRWMSGMMTEGWRLTCVSLHDGAWSATSTFAHREYYYPTLPDLNDPATLGCVVQLVRDATGRKYAYLEYIPLGCWAMVDPIDDRWLREQDYGASEAEALLIALQAAPEAPNDK